MINIIAIEYIPVSTQKKKKKKERTTDHEWYHNNKFKNSPWTN